MKKCILFFAAIWMTLCFCSCDDGRIYEKEVNIQRGGRAMKLTGRFSGISNWTDDYSVVVAGFNDKSEYAVITKSLPVNVADGTDIVMTLGGISDDVKSLKLCVISRLRECIVEFKTMEDEELTAVTDTILMDVGTHINGVYSCRGIADALKYDVRYMWICDSCSYPTALRKQEFTFMMRLTASVSCQWWLLR